MPSGGFNCASDGSYMEHNQPQGLSGPLIACVADVERGKGIGKKRKREGGRGERGREKLPSLSPLSCFSPFPSPSPFCACHALRRLVHSLKPRFYGPLSFRPFFWKLNCFVVFLVFHIVVLIHLELNGQKTLCLNAHPRGALENHTQFRAITDKIYIVTHFQTQTTQKPYPSNFGRHTYITEHPYPSLTWMTALWSSFSTLESSCFSRADNTPREAWSREPGGYSWELIERVCRLVIQTLTLFQTKTLSFPHQFSELASKIHTRFQAWRRQKLCYHIKFRLERHQQRDVLKSLSYSHIYTLSFLFLWNWIDKYVHAFPWKPYPNSDQNRQRVYPFSDRNAQKPYPPYL